MKRLLGLPGSILLLLLMFVQPAVAAEPAPSEGPATEIDGEWQPISIENGTDKLTKEQLSQHLFSFRGNRHTLLTHTDKTNKTTAGLRVDSSKQPKEIDLQLEDAPDAKAEPILGIYKLEGDQLTIAFNRQSPGDRPKAFPGQATAGIEVVTLQRVKLPPGVK